MINDNTTGHNYCDMLQNIAEPQNARTNHIPARRCSNTIHYYNDVRDFLNEQFPGHSVGRRGMHGHNTLHGQQDHQILPLDFFA